MKTSSMQKGITLIDEIFKNKARQNIVGIIVTGLGLTTACAGISILINKPKENDDIERGNPKSEAQK